MPDGFSLEAGRHKEDERSGPGAEQGAAPQVGDSSSTASNEEERPVESEGVKGESKSIKSQHLPSRTSIKNARQL